MEDNRMYEDISVEEFEEAMEGFVQWHREVAEADAIEFDKWVDEMEAEFLADIQGGEWGF